MKKFKPLILLLSLSFAFVQSKAQTNYLAGSNMEDASLWSTSYLNTEVGSEPAVNWNDLDSIPSAGAGGALYINSNGATAQTQYAIYQEVSLSADSIYYFDGAFKYAELSDAWCEVFIGSQPVDGEDYGSGQSKLVNFSFWNNPLQKDGTFAVDGKDYQGFVPPTTGNYYFVLKAGCLSTGAISISVDELKLTADRVKPLVDFSADVVSGFAPLQVQFTSAVSYANSYSWDFGDGTAASTEENPTHTYSAEGIYSVQLTATNEIGDSILLKSDYITVNAAEKLSAGGVLVGGEMDTESKWQTSVLNTPSGSEASVSWNDTAHTPSAGKDGALYVSGLSNNTTVQYAIYQEVSLSADSTYTFNAAIKDFTTNLNQSWVEVYIGSQPIDGLDYSKDDPDNHIISNFSSWSADCNPKGVDGTFLLNACDNTAFSPDNDGKYYFVLKLGSTSWAGDDMPFSIALDELSLTAERTKPTADFSADPSLGFAPLDVQFTDKSKFATSWAWDFGDGSTISNEQNPSHNYTNPGTYDVSLTTTNELGSSSLQKTGFIKVNAKPDLPEGEMLYGGNMEDPNLWNITTLNATAITTATWNYRDNTLTYGEGGNLHLSATAQNSTSQYCIWQSVELKAGKRYTFSGAFRDLSSNLDHFWSEVFIGTTPPEDGADYGDGQTKIEYFNTWDCGSSPGLDGTYQDNACGDDPKGVFVPETDGTYYFALKTGITDWENTAYSFDVMIDELSLMESENIPDPAADFFADITSGDAPLTVYFTDLSSNATSWLWDFGDGSSSTDQNPVHVYTSGGVFSVSLTAYNSQMTPNTLLVSDLISVNGPTGLEDPENLKSKIYPNPSRDNIYIKLNKSAIENIKVYDFSGRIVKPTITSSTDDLIKINFEQAGIYFLKISKEGREYVQKVVIQK